MNDLNSSIVSYKDIYILEYTPCEWMDKGVIEKGSFTADYNSYNNLTVNN